MRTSGTSFLIAVLIITALCTMRNFSANGTPTKTTTTTSLEENDYSETEFDESEKNSFRERYRRLIPYMTYYVSNNYVNQQSPYYNGRIIAPGGTTTVQRRPQGYNIGGSRINSGVQLQSNLKFVNNENIKLGTSKTKTTTTTTTSKYYVNPPINREKFVPSVQYDPTDMDNEEFFTPVVRYNPHLNFDDYQSAFYQRYQTPSRFEIQGTKTAEEDFRQRIQAQQQQQQQQQQHRLLTTIGPLQTTVTFTPGYGDLLVRKPTTPRPTPRPEYIITTKRPPKPELVPRPFQLATTVEKSTDLTRRPAQANLNHIVKSLQLTNQLPEILNADNIDESIKTLVEILSILNNGGRIGASSVGNGEFEPVNPLPKRIETTARRPPKPIIVQDEGPGPYHVNLIDLGGKYFPAKVENAVIDSTKSSYVDSSATGKGDDFTYGRVTETPIFELGVAATTEKIPSTTEEPVAQNYPPPDGAASHVQNFPPTSLKYGATRGKPKVDYPAYATIPKTEFNCGDQRYKGFFGDPDTGCQVWHYCDLNGGMSSFLCPNGTIFSQVALTCDWWFNVKCESTTQLYVLNERLYKYILPVMPKFPEDFTGPEVDRYLELKFKEMETKMREKKLRKQQQERNKAMKNNQQIQDDNKSASE